LNRYAAEVDGFHTVASGFVGTIAALIAERRHRPELPPDQASRRVAGREPKMTDTWIMLARFAAPSSQDTKITVC